MGKWISGKAADGVKDLARFGLAAEVEKTAKLARKVPERSGKEPRPNSEPTLAWRN